LGAVWTLSGWVLWVLTEPEGKMVRVSEPPGDGGAPPGFCVDSVWAWINLDLDGFIWVWMDPSGFEWIHLDLGAVWILSGWALSGS